MFTKPIYGYLFGKPVAAEKILVEHDIATRMEY